MFEVKITPLKEAGVLNNLLKDYVEGKNYLNSFYDHFPSKEGFTGILEKNNFKNLDRERLADILISQANRVKNTSEKSKKNIELLKDQNTFTITTGHQLCLFTGPLYFLYKIFSVINLAEELKIIFPEKKFIPVYWAATEDHDFEEINHFNVFGKTINWASQQQGAVGDFNTGELQPTLTSLKEVFGATQNANYLCDLFEKAYLRHASLADAARYLVNEIFGEYGLVTVDGNDTAFKSQFIPQFKKDIFENIAYGKVNESIESLKRHGYQAQVNPRPINCFYMEKGLRARIEQENDLYKITGTEKTFTKDELNKLIEHEPDKISPNVVLRPLYQQTILPNIAYIGGPGELAYWLEYKAMFEEFETVFPVLVPRSSITIIEKGMKAKLDKLGLTLEDISKEEQELIKVFRVRSNNIFDLDTEKKRIEQLYSEIAEKISVVDKTLTGSVSAEQQKNLNSLDALVAKANRALKQKSDTEINQLKSIKEKLFPGKIPQERYDNFSAYYIKWGQDLFKTLKENIKPLELTHSSLIER